MRFQFLILSFSILFSCQTKNNSVHFSQTSDTTKKTETHKLQQFEKVYKWTGHINSSIPIFMWFVARDSVIKGELTYLKTKNKRPLTILGTITDEGIKILEFQKDGTITGTFTGKSIDKEFKGSWYAPSSEKELAFLLESKDTSFTTKDTTLSPVNISGEYLYKFGKEGYEGGIDVKQINDNLVSFDISCVTSPPSFNVAEVTADSVQIKNNRIIYKIPDTEKCQFRIRIFKDFLIINYIDKQYECGFGLNAEVDGIFIKTR